MLIYTILAVPSLMYSIRKRLRADLFGQFGPGLSANAWQGLWQVHRDAVEMPRDDEKQERA